MAAVIGIVAGLLMLLAGTSGATSIDRVFEFLQNRLGGGDVIRLVSYVLIAIASLGGFAVMLGSVLFLTDRVRAGRILIALGAGFGLIGLILFVLIGLERQEIPFMGGIGLGALGLILSIGARLKSEVVVARR